MSKKLKIKKKKKHQKKKKNECKILIFYKTYKAKIY